MKKLLTFVCTCIIIFVFSYLTCKAYHEQKLYAPNYVSSTKETQKERYSEIIKSIQNYKPKKIIKVSKTEMKMFMYTVEMEAHDLTLEHKQAIAKVIVNRLNHDKFKYKTIKEVLSAKKQFNGFRNFKLQKFHPNLDTFIACKQALSDSLRHLDDDMVYFYNPSKSAKKVHNFFEKKQFAMEMDGHRFFLSE